MKNNMKKLLALGLIVSSITSIIHAQDAQLVRAYKELQKTSTESALDFFEGFENERKSASYGEINQLQTPLVRYHHDKSTVSSRELEKIEERLRRLMELEYCAFRTKKPNARDGINDFFRLPAASPFFTGPSTALERNSIKDFRDSIVALNLTATFDYIKENSWLSTSSDDQESIFYFTHSWLRFLYYVCQISKSSNFVNDFSREIAQSLLNDDCSPNKKIIYILTLLAAEYDDLNFLRAASSMITDHQDNPMVEQFSLQQFIQESAPVTSATAREEELPDNEWTKVLAKLEGTPDANNEEQIAREKQAVLDHNRSVAAETIQRGTRSSTARNKLAQLKKEKAAEKIQTTFRKFQAKKQTDLLRANLAKSKKEQALEQRQAQAIEKSKTNRAVTTLQRSFKARKAALAAEKAKIAQRLEAITQEELAVLRAQQETILAAPEDISKSRDLSSAEALWNKSKENLVAKRSWATEAGLRGDRVSVESMKYFIDNIATPLTSPDIKNARMALTMRAPLLGMMASNKEFSEAIAAANNIQVWTEIKSILIKAGVNIATLLKISGIPDEAKAATVKKLQDGLASVQ